MGLFSTSAPESQSPSAPQSEAPNRNERAHCWEMRDAFFKCLDRNQIIDSIKDDRLAGERCGAQGQAFEKACASSWVTYFKKRRVMEHQKAETLARIKAEGAQPLPSGAVLPTNNTGAR